jgi:hypothetical protein
MATTLALGVATTASGVLALKERAAYFDALRDPRIPVSGKWRLREAAAEVEHRTTVLGVLAVAAAGATVTLYTWTGRAARTRVAWGPFGPEVDGSF